MPAYQFDYDRDLREAFTAFSAETTAALTGFGFRYSLMKKFMNRPVKGARYAKVRADQLEFGLVRVLRLLTSCEL